MANRGNLRPTTPGGDGEIVTAAELLERHAIASQTGRMIRLNPGGGEYEAFVVDVRPQPVPAGWVRLTHRRVGVDTLTVNVVAAGVEIRFAD